MDIQNLIRQAFDKKAYSPGVYQGERLIKKGRPGETIPFFPSYKNALSMPCESKLEEAHCLLLEYSPEVVRYRTQPFTLRFAGNRSYTPDAIIEKHDGSYEAVEVKVSATLENEKIHEKLATVKRLFEKFNIYFYVITEKEILRKSSHENRQELYQYLRAEYSKLVTHEVLREIKKDLPITFDSAMHRAKSLGFSMNVIRHLIATGELIIDLDKKINGKTQIYAIREIADV